VGIEIPRTHVVRELRTRRATERRTIQMIPTTELDAELAPDTILPVQFSSMWHRRSRGVGEKLACAILEQAVRDLRTFRNARRQRDRRWYFDAHGWVCSDDRSYEFSFVNICDALGLSVDALRARLLGPEQQAERAPLSEAA
jgi:hypothetical protein